MNTAPQKKQPSLQDLIVERANRRQFMGGLGATLAALPFTPLFGCTTIPGSAPPVRAAPPETQTLFAEVPQGIDTRFHIPPNHRSQVLLRWGDPILPGAAPFSPRTTGPDAQRGQFGTNCDFIAFMPLPFGSQSSDHGLLCVNHEYPSPTMMLPGFTRRKDARDKCTREQSQMMMAAMGHSVVEVKRDGEQWNVVEGDFNRRVTLLDTPMDIGGPLRGHPRMRTTLDPEGETIIGTMANCSGGVTPWGTVLISEENIEHYFVGEKGHSPEADHHERFGLYSEPRFPFYRFEDRFHLNREENEANRFGWVVEIDPYDPSSRPVKRTAMGRITRESATTVLNHDGRVVVYSGDDHYFEYLYRFVSADRFDPDHPRRNRDLLDKGTLSVAQFGTDGSFTWIPLEFGQGPLTRENRFNDQADVLLETRRAADLVGATPMDRPEDIDVHPKTGRVYVMLTKNHKRSAEQAGDANPRADNHHGHILELSPPAIGSGEVDHAAKSAHWDILLLGGDPNNPKHRARYHPGTSPDGYLANPDNCTFDNQGRLWVSTDGAEGTLNTCDGIWVCETEGDQRALTRRFLRVPIGAELCSPQFTPDNKTLFVSVQHPGSSKGSSFDHPSTRWPDFDEKLPPRASVVAIRHHNGDVVGRG